MLTIHAADRVRRGRDPVRSPAVAPAADHAPLAYAAPIADGGPLVAGAVAVRGDRIVALGALAELRERFPDARVRRWPGALGPALVHPGPLPEAPTPRERVHAVLKTGATAVLEEHAGAAGVRAAAERAGVAVLPHSRPVALAEGGRADLAVFDDDGRCVATVCAGRLVHRSR